MSDDPMVRPEIRAVPQWTVRITGAPIEDDEADRGVVRVYEGVVQIAHVPVHRERVTVGPLAPWGAIERMVHDRAVVGFAHRLREVLGYTDEGGGTGG